MHDISLSPALTWAIVGVVLLIIELTSFTFVLAFLGVGAFITAIAAWAGVTPGLNGQLIVFSASSLVLLVLLRKTARRLFSGQGGMPSDDIGHRVKVIKEIPPEGEGAVLHRGSVWDAVSDSKDAIPEGSTVEITGTEGIRLKVRKV
ncbi:MAG: NfeD family protein [Deltaproteobacteria bacterium]|nr:NfeD family protein [Deltaproteobacteria bacterium]